MVLPKLGQIANGIVEMSDTEGRRSPAFDEAASSVKHNTVGTSVHGKVVNVELILNITLTNKGGISKEYLAKAIKESDGKRICHTRSAGMVLCNSKDQTVFAQFVPLPYQEECQYGRNNMAVWRATFEDGKKVVLNKEQTYTFWEDIIGTDARNTNFAVKIDLPITPEKLRTELEVGGTRAVSIKFGPFVSFEIYKNTYRSDKDSEGESHWYFVPPKDATISLLTETVGIGSLVVGTTLTPDIILDTVEDPYEAARAVISADKHKLTTNAKKRWERYGKLPKGWTVDSEGQPLYIGEVVVPDVVESIVDTVVTPSDGSSSDGRLSRLEAMMSSMNEALVKSNAELKVVTTRAVAAETRVEELAKELAEKQRQLDIVSNKGKVDFSAGTIETPESASDLWDVDSVSNVDELFG